MNCGGSLGKTVHPHGPFCTDAHINLTYPLTNPAYLLFDRGCCCQYVHLILRSPSVYSYDPSLFVLLGPWRALCHLPLPWRQQLLRPHHPGFCDDVAARGRGSRHLLRAAPKVSTAAFHPADRTCLVPRTVARLGGKRPRLGLIEFWIS